LSYDLARWASGRPRTPPGVVARPISPAPKATSGRSPGRRCSNSTSAARWSSP